MSLFKQQMTVTRQHLSNEESSCINTFSHETLLFQSYPCTSVCLLLLGILTDFKVNGCMVQHINLTLFPLFFLKLAALDKLLDLHIQVCYRLSLLFSEVIQVLVSVLSMSARFCIIFSKAGQIYSICSISST